MPCCIDCDKTLEDVLLNGSNVSLSHLVVIKRIQEVIE